jgi:hypothetical protein
MALPLAWARKPQCYQVTSVPGNKLLMQSAGQLHCRRTDINDFGFLWAGFRAEKED